ncbi:hypothetical protein BN11_660013 [Nostocoides australiense Ben110]|uniref:Uncharacterized protein n=1 Tax=Nostocoides australiense Ben110 TaxID=1193182 RepID=W6K2P2_9MICO|nr:hypothetical protein BN11_660013 [Tetrasphaera australiensis Ben110]
MRGPRSRRPYPGHRAWRKRLGRLTTRHTSTTIALNSPERTDGHGPDGDFFECMKGWAVRGRVGRDGG